MVNEAETCNGKSVLRFHESLLWDGLTSPLANLGIAQTPHPSRSVNHQLISQPSGATPDPHTPTAIKEMGEVGISPDNKGLGCPDSGCGLLGWLVILRGMGWTDVVGDATVKSGVDHAGTGNLIAVIILLYISCW